MDKRNPKKNGSTPIKKEDSSGTNHTLPPLNPPRPVTQNQPKDLVTLEFKVNERGKKSSRYNSEKFRNLPYPEKIPMIRLDLIRSVNENNRRMVSENPRRFLRIQNQEPDLPSEFKHLTEKYCESLSESSMNAVDDIMISEIKRTNQFWRRRKKPHSFPLINEIFLNKSKHPFYNTATQKPKEEEKSIVSKKKSTEKKQNSNSDVIFYEIGDTPGNILSAEQVCDVLVGLFKKFPEPFAIYDLKTYQLDLVILFLRKIFIKVQRHYKTTKKFDRINKLVTIEDNLSYENISILFHIFLSTDFSCVKRKEEKLKFVMKNTIKYFRQRYFQHYKLKTCLQSEMTFLKAFFQDHVKTYNYPAKDFSDPLSNLMIRNTQFRSLSNDYLEKVFKLKDFKNMFFAFLDRGLKETYQTSLRWKWRKILKPLRDLLKSGKGEKQCYREFMKFVYEKDTYKIPWFDWEIDNAIRVFKTHVESLLH